MVDEFAKVMFLQASSMTSWKTFMKKLADLYVDEDGSKFTNDECWMMTSGRLYVFLEAYYTGVASEKTGLQGVIFVFRESK